MGGVRKTARVSVLVTPSVKAWLRRRARRMRVTESEAAHRLMQEAMRQEILAAGAALEARRVGRPVG